MDDSSRKAINTVAVAMLNEEARKFCFERCFRSSRSFQSGELSKNEKICLAKCMDRMFEAHGYINKAILLRASPSSDNNKNTISLSKS